MGFINSFSLLLLLVYLGHCYPGVVASIKKYPTAVYQCVRQKGFVSACIKVGSTQQDLMKQDVQNAFNSANAGLTTNIIFLPCKGNDYKVEADKIIKTFQNRLFQRVWLAPDGGQSPTCSWKIDDAERNCDFMRNLAYTIKNNGFRVGVALNQQTWLYYFHQQCAGLEQVTDLFWINFDNQANFDNYKQIGGWITPIVKMYAQGQNVCGVAFELTYSLY